MEKWWTELLLWYSWPTRAVYLYFQAGPLSEILTIANLRPTASRIWTYAEPEFRFYWMKLCSSDNHYTTVPSKIDLFIFLALLILKICTFKVQITRIYLSGISPCDMWEQDLLLSLSFQNSYIGSYFSIFDKPHDLKSLITSLLNGNLKSQC